VLLGAVFGLSVVAYFLIYSNGAGANVLSVVAAIGSIAGIAFIFCISRLYMLRTVPAWSTWTTPAQFFLTTLLLGAVAIGALFVLTVGSEAGAAMHKVGLAVLVWACAQLIVMIVATIRQAPKQHRLLTTLRAILTLSGAIMFYVIASSCALGRDVEAISVGAIVVSFLLVLAGEIIGRFLFFASFKRVGI
jgi:anaerobic dimethyl sulfoxide reductase subunit C (anchor subunit)